MKKPTTYLLFAVAIGTLFFSCGATHKKNRYVKKNYAEIKKSFPSATVSLIQDSIKVIFPNNIIFDIGKANIKPTFNEKLNRFSEILKKFSRTNLLINGYTDNSGSEENNLKLSLARSENVQKVIKDQGIAADRLFTWGLGEKNPIAKNNTEEGRARNRRVEFIVLYKL